MRRVLRCYLQFCKEFMALHSFTCRVPKFVNLVCGLESLIIWLSQKFPSMHKQNTHEEKVKETRTECTLSSKWGFQFHTALLMRKQLITFLEIIVKSHEENKKKNPSFLSLKQFLVISLEADYKTYRSPTKCHRSLDLQQLFLPVWKLEAISE